MDWTDVAVQAIVALTPVVTLVAVWGLKAAYNKIPASWLFAVTPVVGIVFNYAATWLTDHQGDFSVIIAAVAGLGAIVLREFLTTLQTKGLLGPITLTKKLL